MGATDRERNAAKKKQAAELRKAEKRKAEIDSLFMKLYEDWSADRITEYNFTMLSEKYQDEQQALTDQIAQLKEALAADRQTTENTAKWLELIKRYISPAGSPPPAPQAADIHNGCTAPPCQKPLCRTPDT